MTERYTKMATAISVTTVPLKNAATGFVDNWVIPYRSPTSLLPENGLHFVWKFSAAVIVHLDVKHLSTNPYHTQTNGQASTSKERSLHVSNIMLQNIRPTETST